VEVSDESKMNQEAANITMANLFDEQSYCDTPLSHQKKIRENLQNNKKRRFYMKT